MPRQTQCTRFIAKSAITKPAARRVCLAPSRQPAPVLVLRNPAGLQSSAKGARIRFEGGKRRVIDGPFAETKEQLLGLYVVNCDSADAALDVARDLRRVNPSAVYEIRPIRLYLPGEAVPETASEGQG